MSKLFANERRNLIMEILNVSNRVTVKELSNRINVSEATLRTDLKFLEELNLLTRTHGGAILNDEQNIKKSFSEREKRNRDSKVVIAKKAINLINYHDCILLDASTTCLELAKLIAKSDMKVTVLTNGLSTAIELKENPNINTILIGGLTRIGSMATEGILGKDIFENIHIDKLFTSASGFTVDQGLTDFNIYEIDLKREMIRNSPKHIVLIDHSKIGVTSIASFATIDQIHTLISDIPLEKSMLDKLQAVNVEVL